MVALYTQIKLVYWYIEIRETWLQYIFKAWLWPVKQSSEIQVYVPLPAFSDDRKLAVNWQINNSWTFATLLSQSYHSTIKN